MQQRRCALLTFLIGFVLLTAHCGDEVVAPTSGAAGKVISAKGEVTATKDGEESRALHVNDIVYVEDTVKTGANSSVTIELSHNHAAWSLDENETRRTKESIAWNAAKQKASAFDNREATGTAVAASDSTQTAGDTASTATDNERAALLAEAARAEPSNLEVPAAQAPAAPMAAGVSLSDSQPPGRGSRAPVEGVGNRGPKKETSQGSGPRAGSQAPPPPKTEKKKAETPSLSGPPPPVRPRRALPSKTKQKKTSKRPPKTVANAPSPPPPPVKVAAPAPKSPPKTKTPTFGLLDDGDRAKTKALVRSTAKACHEKHGGTGDLHYKLVVKDGKFVSFKTKQESALTPLAKCMKTKLKASSLKGLGSASGRIKLKP